MSELEKNRPLRTIITYVRRIANENRITTYALILAKLALEPALSLIPCIGHVHRFPQLTTVGH